MQKRLQVVVTKNAMSILSDVAKSADSKRAVEQALRFAEGVEFENPRTVMIENCPLGLHIDPKRGIVVLLSASAAWPAVTDELVDELLPFTTGVALA